MDRRTGAMLLAAALLGFAAVRLAAVHSVAFNWDELALFRDAALSAETGQLHSAGHAGLPQAALTPLLADCRDEIGVGRTARVAWLALTWLYLAGVFALLRALLPADRHRSHDAALGTALLGLTPVFLEWSIQVRTDQVALASGAWGAWALLASRRRPALALLAGACLGAGWLATQKLAYLAALAALLAAGDLFVRREWRTARELARASGAGIAAAAVVGGWVLFVRAAFTLPDQHPALAPLAAPLVANYLDIFGFYRATIGYGQYLDALPGLGPHAFLLAAALAALLVAAARTRRLALAAAVLALGLGVGLFHAAAFAYFLMTLGLFAAVALGLALPSIRAAAAARWPDAARLATPVLWAALAGAAGLQSLDALRDTQAVQRESLRFVHRNFAPERAGFHPETGVFCGMRQPLGLWFSQRIYRAFGPHVADSDAAAERLIERFRAEPVHYLVQSFRLNQFPAPLRRFWDENYQPYRDAVFVAGRRLRADAAEPVDFDLLVAGPYRWFPLGGAYPVAIDGRSVGPGEALALDAGPHRARFAPDGGRGVLVLALDEPPGPAPREFYKSY